MTETNVERPIITNIQNNLQTDFEKELFAACLANLQEVNNKLRFNNFAYSMRELIRTFLDRLSPIADVLAAPWFIPNDPTKPKIVTRKQRLKFAIQGWLSDEFVENNFSTPINPYITQLVEIIDDLSKYTHISQETFYVTERECLKKTHMVLQITSDFFTKLAEYRELLLKLIKEYLTKDVLDRFWRFMEDTYGKFPELYEFRFLTFGEWNIEFLDNVLIRVISHGHGAIKDERTKISDDLRNDGTCEISSIPYFLYYCLSYKNSNGNIQVVPYSAHVSFGSERRNVHIKEQE